MNLTLPIPCACFLALAATAPAMTIGVDDFARYQVILDRKPFGQIRIEAPAAPAAPQAPTALEVATKHLRLTGLVQRKDGLRIGIVDDKTKKSYFVSLDHPFGEEGMRVIDADYENKEALIEKEGEEIWITMQGPTGAAAGGETPTAAAPGAPRPRGPVPMPVNRSASQSARSRLRARQLEKLREHMEQPKLSGEELTKHLREYNLELIRAGGTKGPPLPIPLTAEEDATLVQEGVLPPSE